MPAREILCRITKSEWISPQVLRVVFEPNKKLAYQGGQFLSIYVPRAGEKPLRRAYSFATGPEVAKSQGYELCIKVSPQGKGSQYMASLKVGDSFKATAPYGDFTFQTRADRDACFVCTGTGIAPIKAILESKAFYRDPPRKATLIFGVRGPADILHGQALRLLPGIEVIFALSQPGKLTDVFSGRVTDFLRQAPMDWNWQSTDFYLCGNPEMIVEAERILHEGRAVPTKSIFKEAYFPIQAAAKSTEERSRLKAA